MKILAVDTSAKSASVALTENGEIKGEFFINTMLTHSETLMPMIDAVLKSTHLTPTDVDCLAVNTGPGSFTGLRIGIAAVKGIAFALDLPCVGVSTLLTMAYNFKYSGNIVCAVMDARCNQVYNALFDVSGDTPVRLCEDRALTIDELSAEISSSDRQYVLVGDGAKLCSSKMTALTNVALANENVRYQRAAAAAFAAERLFEQGRSVSANELAPQYLRLPQAQRELLARQNRSK